MHEPRSASLHAGLIERAKPRPALAPGVIPLMPRVPGATQAPAGFGRRRVFDDEADDVLQPVKASIMMPHPPSEHRQTDLPAAMHARRYGLTVRVDPETRLQLVAEKQRTGQTTQDILATALRQYLVETPGRPDPAA